MFSKLWPRFLCWFASHLHRRDICNDKGDVYLERYRILGWIPGSNSRLPFNIYLHRFRRGDEDDQLHNHPWKWAVSFILTNGYVEDRRCEIYGYAVNMRVIRAPAINVIRGDTYHRVDLIADDCWTLFITGPKTSSWGFWNRYTGKFTEWRARLRERGITPVSWEKV